MKMTQQELQRLGFISQEQYDWAKKTVESDGTGEFAPGGALGFNLPPTFAAQTESYSKRIPDSEWGSFESNSDYPESVFLTDDPPRVYQQANRGTCVAHAVTSLLEYYRGGEERLSMQHLYARIKEYEFLEFKANYENYFSGKISKVDRIFVMRLQYFIAKYCEKYNIPPEKLPPEVQQRLALEHLNPAPSDGSHVATAFAVLKQGGICRYDVWPYSQTSMDGNAGQLPIPAKAAADAEHRKFEDDFYVLGSPNSVEEYRAILSGANGMRPMPVSVGVGVFSSWQNSPFTKRTGWFGMPLIDDEKGLEEAVGGHEMLIVGYKDEPLVAGGGYFLVRNSWGKSWAWESEYPGHAKIPYAYIRYFANEAGTIQQPKERAAAPRKPAAAPVAETTGTPEVNDTKYDIFISYRRNGALREAKHLTDRLLKDGYCVSLDIENLGEGNFRRELARRVEQCTDFIILLSPGAFDKCLDGKSDREEDIFYDELATAFAQGKHIVPVKLANYTAPAKSRLPHQIREIVELNYLELNYDYFNMHYVKLTSILRSKADYFKAMTPGAHRIQPRRTSIAAGAGPVLQRENMGIRVAGKLLSLLIWRGVFGVNGENGKLDRDGCERHLSQQLAEGKPFSIDLHTGGNSSGAAFKFDPRKKLASAALPGHAGNSKTDGFYLALASLRQGASMAGRPEPVKHETVKSSPPPPPVEENKPAPEPKAAEPAAAPAAHDAPAGVRNQFRQTIHANLADKSAPYCFPDLNLPSSVKFLPWQIQVREVTQRADITELWIGKLADNGLIEPGDRQHAAKTNAVTIYELKNGSVSFLVASVFITPIRNGLVEPAVPAAYLPVLQELLRDSLRFAENHYCRRVACFAKVIGSSSEIAPELQKQFSTAPDGFTLYCRHERQEWRITFPPFKAGSAWWQFVPHLLPVTSGELEESFKRCCRLLEESPTRERLRRAWGMPGPIFDRTVAGLMRRGEFECRKSMLTECKEPKCSMSLSQTLISGCRGCSEKMAHEFWYALLKVGAMTLGLYICIHLFVSSRYSLLTVLCLALGSALVEIYINWDKRRVAKKENS